MKSTYGRIYAVLIIVGVLAAALYSRYAGLTPDSPTTAKLAPAKNEVAPENPREAAADEKKESPAAGGDATADTDTDRDAQR